MKTLKGNELSPREAKLISDWWLAGIEIDEVLQSVLIQSKKENWTDELLAEKLLLVRCRYLELDMIDIQQEMAIRFFPEEREEKRGHFDA